MGMVTQKNYRLLLYVNSLLIVLLGAAVAAWGIFWLFPSGLGEGYGAVLASVQGIGQVLFKKVAIIYAIIAVLIVMAMVVLHLFYSHRIAGPAYRLGMEAAKVANGNLTGNIKFRKKDSLTDMADSLNNVASQYRRRITAVKENLAIIETQSKKVSDLIRQGKDGVALEQAADELSGNIKNIEQLLSEMRT